MRYNSGDNFRYRIHARIQRGWGELGLRPLPPVAIGFMGGSRNSRQGGPGQSDKRSSDKLFLVLSLFYRSQMVHFKENYHFSGFRRGSNFFQGGPTFYRGGGGGNCLFAIETHITCNFPGAVRTPYSPWIRTWVFLGILVRTPGSPL